MPEGQPALTRLRQDAARLVAELDGARFHQAAAYAAMAVDAIDTRLRPATNDNSPGGAVDLEFHLDEHARVWMILEGDCYILGGKDEVRREMWRFLRLLLPGLA